VNKIASVLWLFTCSFRVGLVFLCSEGLPEGVNLIPKHVGIRYLSRRLCYKVHLLVDLLYVSQMCCTV
jgi:hypothetical protein